MFRLEDMRSSKSLLVWSSERCTHWAHDHKNCSRCIRCLKTSNWSWPAAPNMYSTCLVVWRCGSWIFLLFIAPFVEGLLRRFLADTFARNFRRKVAWGSTQTRFCPLSSISNLISQYRKPRSIHCYSITDISAQAQVRSLNNLAPLPRYEAGWRSSHAQIRQIRSAQRSVRSWWRGSMLAWILNKSQEITCHKDRRTPHRSSAWPWLWSKLEEFPEKSPPKVSQLNKDRS